MRTINRIARHSVLALIALVLVMPAPAQKKKAAAAGKSAPASGVYVTIDTTMGKIVCQLFEKETPKTVANFIGLAQGTKEWKHPRTNQKVNKPFYNGLSFHRVIPNFMIQGGDPLGNGTGGPGYKFEDEIVPSLKFDRPGKLAMANAGPNTNGSQFFITVVATAHLNGKHTIFGQVVEGMDVATAIANTPRDLKDKPKTPVVMKNVTIERIK